MPGEESEQANRNPSVQRGFIPMYVVSPESIKSGPGKSFDLRMYWTVAIASVVEA